MDRLTGIFFRTFSEWRVTFSEHRSGFSGEGNNVFRKLIFYRLDQNTLSLISTSGVKTIYFCLDLELRTNSNQLTQKKALPHLSQKATKIANLQKIIHKI
jgi:hypothetical protein